MALRDEYYLCFHFILVIRRAFFSIISMDQIFQVARQTCCCTLAAQDAWDILLLPLGTLDPDSHSTLTLCREETRAGGTQPGCGGAAPPTRAAASLTHCSRTHILIGGATRQVRAVNGEQSPLPCPAKTSSLAATAPREGCSSPASTGHREPGCPHPAPTVPKPGSSGGRTEGCALPARLLVCSPTAPRSSLRRLTRHRLGSSSRAVNASHSRAGVGTALGPGPGHPCGIRAGGTSCLGSEQGL